jgi:hypothetical protein
MKAMKRVNEIKERRQKKFYEKRMEIKKQVEYNEGIQGLSLFV